MYISVLCTLEYRDLRGETRTYHAPIVQEKISCFSNLKRLSFKIVRRLRALRSPTFNFAHVEPTGEPNIQKFVLSYRTTCLPRGHSILVPAHAEGIPIAPGIWVWPRCRPPHVHLRIFVLLKNSRNLCTFHLLPSTAIVIATYGRTSSWLHGPLFAPSPRSIM